uniref:Uncharacterized protein n=1 Tax=Anguilla anguilla TaxID=7936 RepID=A0A0E9UC41_ANGAN
MPSLVSTAMASKLFRQSVMDPHPTNISNKNLPPHLCQLRLNTRGLNCSRGRTRKRAATQRLRRSRLAA